MDSSTLTNNPYSWLEGYTYRPNDKSKTNDNKETKK